MGLIYESSILNIEKSYYGCNETDFKNDLKDKLALVFRGKCDFDIKAKNSIKANASALVVINSDDVTTIGVIPFSIEGEYQFLISYDETKRLGKSSKMLTTRSMSNDQKLVAIMIENQDGLDLIQKIEQLASDPLIDGLLKFPTMSITVASSFVQQGLFTIVSLMIITF